MDIDRQRSINRQGMRNKTGGQRERGRKSAQVKVSVTRRENNIRSESRA